MLRSQDFGDHAPPVREGPRVRPNRTMDGLPLPRRYWAIAAISFGTALFVIDGAIANVAMPTIAQDLHVSNASVTNIVTVYQLVLVMVLLPFSNVGDRIGLRKLYQIGQVVFLLASAVVLFIKSFPLLLLARAGQAFGAGMALSVSAAILREVYPAKSLGSGMGINSVVVASSSALAPTLGGWIVADFDWRWVFVAAVPAAIVSLLLGRSLPDPFKVDREHEVLSGVWSAITVLMLIGGIQIATHAGTIITGAVISLVGLVSAVLLVRREKRRPMPVVPVDIIAMPVIGLSALAAVCAFIASGSLRVSLPFLFEVKLGFPPAEVGLLLLAFMPAHPGPFNIAWRLALTALGFGLFFAPNSRLLIGQAPKNRAAAAGGLLSTSRLSGQTLAAAIVGILLSAGLGLGPTPMLVACALSVVAALCSFARYTTVTRSGMTMSDLKQTT